MPDLKENLVKVNHAIAAACAAVGRDPSSVRLLAVTKGHGAATIRELYQLGCRRFGESYLTEIETKWPQLQDLPDLEIVFIGPLQSNKIKRVIAVAAEIQSIASVKHLRLVAKAVSDNPACPRPFPLYLNVNAGAEEQKQGFAFSQLNAAVEFAGSLAEIDLRGLMAIPPKLEPHLSLNPGEAPELYLRLAQTRQRLGLTELSVGMSSDLAPAIAAGSTEVRIGTALCGPRPA